MNVDVLVAGGRPESLSAAATAAHERYNVVVIEKGKEIGKIVRTRGVSWIKEMNSAR